MVHKRTKSSSSVTLRQSLSLLLQTITIFTASSNRHSWNVVSGTGAFRTQCAPIDDLSRVCVTHNSVPRISGTSVATDGASFGIGRGGLVTTVTRREGTRRDAARRDAARRYAPRQAVGRRNQVTGRVRDQVLTVPELRLRTFRTWLLRKLSSSSAVAVKSCFAIASIFCPPRRRSRRETTCRCCWKEREGARCTPIARCPHRGETQNGVLRPDVRECTWEGNGRGGGRDGETAGKVGEEENKRERERKGPRCADTHAIYFVSTSWVARNSLNTRFSQRQPRKREREDDIEGRWRSEDRAHKAHRKLRAREVYTGFAR